MRLRNSATRYGAGAQLLHWAIAALIVALLPIGWYMVGLPLSMDKFRYYELHKSLGLLVLGGMVLRLIWRLFNQPPPLPQTMPTWERHAASLTHIALYGAVFVQVILGLFLTWTANSALTLFGWFTVPSPVAPNETLSKTISLIHFWVGNGIVSLIGLHAAAAFRHHFIQKDDILRRMLPRFGSAEPTHIDPGSDGNAAN